MKKALVVLIPIIVFVVVFLFFGYHIEYDTVLSDVEIIDYYKAKDNNAINNLLSYSSIVNSYCRRSNKDSFLPYTFVNKWLILELECNDNNFSSFKDIQRLDISKDKAYNDIVTKLADLVAKKELLWLKPILEGDNKCYMTYLYYDDLKVKMSKQVYLVETDTNGTVFLIFYQGM